MGSRTRRRQIRRARTEVLMAKSQMLRSIEQTNAARHERDRANRILAEQLPKYILLRVRDTWEQPDVLIAECVIHRGTAFMLDERGIRDLVASVSTDLLLQLRDAAHGKRR